MAEASEQNPDRVRDDLLCFECGYNLRGLPSTGNCPECGSPVLRSIRGDLLRYANQLWVSRMHLGLRAVWWGIPVIFGGLILSWFVVLIFLALEPLVAISLPKPVVTFAGAMVYFAFVMWPVTHAVGWWLATMPDPAEVQPQALERTALRVTGVLVLPVFVVWIQRDSLPFVGTWTPMATEVVTLTCFAFVVYHLHLLVRFMERVHRRCAPPDAKLIDLHRLLIERLRIFLKLVPSFVFALYVFNLVVNLRGFGPPGGGWGEGIGYILTGLLWLVVTGNLVTTIRCVRAERVAAEYQDDSADFGGLAGVGSDAPHSEHSAALPDSDRS